MPSSNQKKLATEQSLKRNFNLITVLGIAFLVVAIITLTYLVKTSLNTPVRLLSLESMAFEAEAELTLYQLSLQTIIIGDQALQPERIDGHWQRARQLVDTLLKGGKYRNQQLSKMDDPTLSKKLEILQTDILQLKTLGDQWMGIILGVSKNQDIKFDHLFDNISVRIKGIQTRLSTDIEQQIDAYNLTIYRLTGGLILSSLVLLTFFYYNNRRYYQANRRLIISEEKTRLLLNASVDVSITINDRLQIESFNKTAETTFGYREAEIVGQPFNILLAEPFASTYLSDFKNYLNNGDTDIIGNFQQLIAQRKDKSTLPMDTKINTIVANGKNIFVATARDISERLKREQQTRDLEARTRAIVDGAVDGIITIDAKGLIETLNPAAEKIFGYLANEVVGNNIKMLMPQPYAAEHDGYLANYQRTGKATIIGLGREVIGQRKNGSTFPMDLSVAEVKLGTRSIFTGIVRDVSERNAAQAELSEVKNTLDQTLDCVYMFEAESLLFFYANHNASAEIGYSNDELMTMRPFDIKPEFDEARFRNTIQPLLDGSISSLVFETIHRHKDGNDIPVEISLQYLDTGRQDGHFVAIVRNIAQRKLAESQLILAKEEAERANHAKSDFLSRMSHELRTPLNAILGFGQLLEMDELNPIQKESVQHIIKAGRHLTGLINEVLDIARIESGRQDLSLEPLKICTLLNETRQLMEPLAAERNIQLQELAHGQCEAHVVADLQRLKQVLLNLISNALKYNHDGGQVTLFCEEKREGILRINIGDTGPGIAPDNLHRIFEPFERLDADARGVEGSGVGLALSKALIEAMGGVLGVDSQVGAGSTFWIELAIIDPPSAGDTAQHRQRNTLAPPEPDNSQTATVLYIEDNIANFRLVEVALSRRPHIQLITAMEGQLGIELALRHQPDVILLDIHLPVLMGDKVLARLRAEPETQHIPIVVVSADATQSKIDKLLAAGAHSYLTKPFNIKELLRTVDSLLETRSN